MHHYNVTHDNSKTGREAYYPLFFKEIMRMIQGQVADKGWLIIREFFVLQWGAYKDGPENIFFAKDGPENFGRL